MRSQRVGDPDHRQADDRRRVEALHALEQRNAEPLALETARAVVGRFGRDVLFDVATRESAEHATRRIEMLLPKTRLQADERNGGVEDHRLTGEPLELRDLRGGVTRFAERRVAERTDLIGPEYESGGVQRGDRACFGERESTREEIGRASCRERV